MSSFFNTGTRCVRGGVVSLASIDGAYFGEVNTPWRLIAGHLYKHGWITDEHRRKMALVWWFGSLIANTYMPHGNLSFFFRASLPLGLAPIYDMSPMLYRPRPQGTLPEVEFKPPPPLPEDLDLYHQAPIWQPASGKSARVIRSSPVAFSASQRKMSA